MHQACHPITTKVRIDWKKMQAICSPNTKGGIVAGPQSRSSFQISSLENTIHSIDPFNPGNGGVLELHRDVRQCFKSVRKHAVNAH
jgi:hypothetical protein